MTQTEATQRRDREREFESVSAQEKEVTAELAVAEQHRAVAEREMADAQRRLDRRTRTVKLLEDELYELGQRKLRVSTRELVERSA